LGVRIFSLAKELNMTSKELMAYLETQGHNVKNHMCTIPDQVAQILRDRLPKRALAKAKAANGGPGVAGGAAAGAGGGTGAVAGKPPFGKPSIVGKAKPVVPSAGPPGVGGAKARPAVQRACTRRRRRGAGEGR
jgi:hypothetical protein